LDVVDTHPEWIGLPFIQEAEELRATNEKAWRWEFLAEVTGAGGNVFSNIRDVRLSDAEIAKFERPRNGVDWGWWPDPWVFLRAAYVPGARKLYIYKERIERRRTPAETGQIIVDELTYADGVGEDAYFHDQLIWCDDTPDGKVQMATYRRDFSLRAHPARKSNMRQLSYEWLAGLREICIDAGRCPEAFKEFTLKEYARDREGRWLNEIPDGNDHTIDALRYAMMDDILRG
jgi:phage terminase large subunit